MARNGVQNNITDKKQNIIDKRSFKECEKRRKIGSLFKRTYYF